VVKIIIGLTGLILAGSLLYATFSGGGMLSQGTLRMDWRDDHRERGADTRKIQLAVSIDEINAENRKRSNRQSREQEKGKGGSGSGDAARLQHRDQRDGPGASRPFDKASSAGRTASGPKPAGDTSGPFENYPPGAANAKDDVTATAAAGVNETPASRLLYELLVRKDYTGDRKMVDWLLTWNVGGYPHLRVIPDFVTTDVSRPTGDNIRKVDVTFRAEYGRSEKGPFRQLKGNKKIWKFDYHDNDDASRQPLTMRVYFVGRRFRDLELSPSEARIRERKYVRDGATGARFVRIPLFDMQLAFKSLRWNNKRDLSGTSQRLIRDPEDKAYFAFVICDGKCPAAPPPPPQVGAMSMLQDSDTIGFEIRFVDAANGNTIDSGERIQALIDDHPFTNCLRDKGATTKLQKDRMTAEKYAWASTFPDACGRLDSVDYPDDDKRVAVVRVTEEHAVQPGAKADAKQESPKDDGILKHPDHPTPSSREIRFRESGGPLIQDLTGKIWIDRGTVPVGPLLAVKDGTVSVPATLFDEDGGKNLTIRGRFKGYEDLPRQRLPIDGDLVLELTPTFTLADLYIKPWFKLLGKPIPAESLLQDSVRCKYQARVVGDGHDSSQEPVDLESFLVVNKGRRLLRVKKQAKAPPQVHRSDKIVFTAAPVGGDHPCLVSEQALGLGDIERDDGLRILPFEIRHPKPWLLIVATSAQFPDGGIPAHEQAQALDDFWYGLIQSLDIAAQPKGNVKRYEWLFARMTEGSAAGKGTTYLAGTESADGLTSRIDLWPTMTEQTFDTLLSTPAQGTTVLRRDELASAIVRFAGANYQAAPGMYHTALWIHGDPLFSSGNACKEFAAQARTLEDKGVRLLEVVAAGKITESGWPAEPSPAPSAPLEPPKALVPYSNQVEYRGIFRCNPERVAEQASAGSRLLVFKYDNTFARNTKENLSNALADALDQLRVLPKDVHILSMEASKGEVK
jgi:hypothetical protein